jgi:CheY-like chemotaxis protein
MALVSVLVVDDDLAVVAAARAVLSTAGYAVHEALSVRWARQRLLASPPDVMITEVLMRDGDGIELISALKAMNRRTRIIAVARRRFLFGLDLLELARMLGADAALDKPLAPERLLATVGRVVDLDAAEG